MQPTALLVLRIHPVHTVREPFVRSYSQNSWLTHCYERPYLALATLPPKPARTPAPGYTSALFLNQVTIPFSFTRTRYSHGERTNRGRKHPPAKTGRRRTRNSRFRPPPR